MLSHKIVESKISNFTDSIRKSVGEQNWYAALTVALTLPDICGKLEFPKLHSGPRYAKWFDKYMGEIYSMNIRNEQITFISGNDAYALRCAYLHGGEANIIKQKKRDMLEEYIFIAPKVIDGVYSGSHKIQVDKKLVLRVDKFCIDVCDSVNDWLVNNSGERIQDSAKRMLEIHNGSINIGSVRIEY